MGRNEIIISCRIIILLIDTPSLITPLCVGISEVNRQLRDYLPLHEMFDAWLVIAVEGSPLLPSPSSLIPYTTSNPLPPSHSPLRVLIDAPSRRLARQCFGSYPNTSPSLSFLPSHPLHLFHTLPATRPSPLVDTSS